MLPCIQSIRKWPEIGHHPPCSPRVYFIPLLQLIKLLRPFPSVLFDQNDQKLETGMRLHSAHLRCTVGWNHVICIFSTQENPHTYVSLNTNRNYLALCMQYEGCSEMLQSISTLQSCEIHPVSITQCWLLIIILIPYLLVLLSLDTFCCMQTLVWSTVKLQG